jgi:hypothetical protein
MAWVPKRFAFDISDPIVEHDLAMTFSRVFDAIIFTLFFFTYLRGGIRPPYEHRRTSQFQDMVSFSHRDIPRFPSHDVT